MTTQYTHTQDKHLHSHTYTRARRTSRLCLSRSPQRPSSLPVSPGPVAQSYRPALSSPSPIAQGCYASSAASWPRPGPCAPRSPSTCRAGSGLGLGLGVGSGSGLRFGFGFGLGLGLGLGCGSGSGSGLGLELRLDIGQQHRGHTLAVTEAGRVHGRGE